MLVCLLTVFLNNCDVARVLTKNIQAEQQNEIQQQIIFIVLGAKASINSRHDVHST